MATNTATDRVAKQLHRVVDHMGADLDRIELLTAALGAFNKPVPGYEPGFQHLNHLRLNAYELDAQIGRRTKSAAGTKKNKSGRKH